MDINIKDVYSVVKKYEAKKVALMAILQDIQEKYNWLPKEALEVVSEKLNVPLIDVYSVATFYRAFTLLPRGRHCVTVCLGTACHVRGAPEVLNRFENQTGVKAGGTTIDHSITLETVNCLGCCALAPVVVVDGKYHAQANSQKVDTILKALKTPEKAVPGKKVTKKAKKTTKTARKSKKNDTCGD